MPLFSLRVVLIVNFLLQTEIIIDSAGTYFEVAADNLSSAPSKKLAQAQISLNDCLACRSVCPPPFPLPYVLIVHKAGASLLPNLFSLPSNPILRCSTFSIRMEKNLQIIKSPSSLSHLNHLPLWLHLYPLRSLLLQRPS